jgi:hypothetical protein
VSLTFVVGTGRCGSTMLSRIIEMHPDVLSVSEFWNILRHQGDQGRFQLPTREISGEEFWRQLAEDNPLFDGMVRAGIKSDEDFYPYDRGRFDLVTGVPRICRPLAAMSDDPDALYDRLATVVPAWPRRPAMEHVRAFFAEVAAMLGRTVIVERTGGGLVFLPIFRTEFPEARYVFLYRDGVDTALSMSRHPQFRLETFQGLAQLVGTQELADLPLSPAIKAARPGDFDRLINPPFDKERFLAYPISLTYFAWIWSSLIRRGVARMREVPHDLWIIMRYESLLKEPRAELEKLAEFIGVPAREQWIERACAFVDPGRARPAKSRVHPGDLAELRSVCSPGTQAFELLEAEHAAAVSLPP